MAPSAPLTFELLDDLLLDVERGRHVALRFVPGVSLGSMVEFFQHVVQTESKVVYEPAEEIDAMRQVLRTRRPAYLQKQSVGIAPAVRSTVNGDDTLWDQFLFTMHKAILAGGFPSGFSSGLVGSLEEMQANIHDHSSATHTGLLAYRVTPGRVEWTASDRGIGVFAGMKQGEFPSLTDAGHALRYALTDGYSRLPVKGRGYGFRQVFKALSARNGMLRFRSDDQLLTMTGVSPTLSRAKLQQRSRVPGFSVTVVCTNPLGA